MKYTAVLLEIQDADVTYKNPVKVTKDFNALDLIGEANVYHKDGKLYADIEVKENADGLTPAIGFSNTGNEKHLQWVGLCSSHNVDKNIKPIG